MARKETFESAVSATRFADEPPTWIREMSAHYAETGTVRAIDALAFRGEMATDSHSADPESNSHNAAATTEHAAKR